VISEFDNYQMIFTIRIPISFIN